jgi:hypothetical protein
MGSCVCVCVFVCVCLHLWIVDCNFKFHWMFCNSIPFSLSSVPSTEPPFSFTPACLLWSHTFLVKCPHWQNIHYFGFPAKVSQSCGFLDGLHGSMLNYRHWLKLIIKMMSQANVREIQVWCKYVVILSYPFL